MERLLAMLAVPRNGQRRVRADIIAIALADIYCNEAGTLGADAGSPRPRPLHCWQGPKYRWPHSLPGMRVTPKRCGPAHDDLPGRPALRLQHGLNVSGGGAVFAAYVVAVVPMLALASVTMRYFVSGLTEGASIWTAIDRDYGNLRIAMQPLFHDIGIQTQAAAA